MLIVENEFPYKGNGYCSVSCRTLSVSIVMGITIESCDHQSLFYEVRNFNKGRKALPVHNLPSMISLTAIAHCKMLQKIVQKYL